ncbi:hypothetical protein [Aurantimonas endophytica]|uniref:DUF3426 domain-containing protein n=1 Tax=Aurantimonas endophytica TaxID=1522175 RepID=A0A7W6HI89_9HYPH|nr:hypothetical protein [Aurantimonas endophytica]MBB4005692.1 hypothetical protein [Aurantimonas endophytica]MCO6406357.1 hypothetical protein [Aurantimonas endophytica]
MTEFRRASPVSDESRHHASPAAPARVIEGTAEVTTRIRREKSAAEMEAARLSLAAPAEADSRPMFGRRSPLDPAGSRRHEPRTAAPDLLWQSLPPRGARPMPGGAARAIIAHARSLRLRDAAYIATAFIVGMFAMPVLILWMAAAPLAASPTGGVILSEVETSLAPRGDGAVLTVAGRIANVADRAAHVPLMHIVMNGPDGSRQVKPLRAGIGELGAGRSVQFLSALAVPAGIEGDIAVDFAAGGL